MSRKKSTGMYLAALLLFLGGASYLVYTGLAENTVYFLNVSEALAAPADKLGSVRLFGTVAPADIAPAAQGPGVSFTLEDKDNAAQTLRVRYKGAVPDAFKAGAEVIVEGSMAPDGAFSARTLMTKCPSKYQKENREKG